MTETNSTQEKNRDQEAVNTPNASGIIGLSATVIQEVQEFLSNNKRTLEVEIFNQTEFILKHYDMYAAHGSFGAVAELPLVAPLATDKEGNEYEFPQAMGVADITLVAGSAGVMVWEVVDAGLYLIACGYVHGAATNSGYFSLSESAVEAESWWSDNSDNLVNQGSIGKECNTTVGDILITGTMDDLGNGSMVITLAPAS